MRLEGREHRGDFRHLLVVAPEIQDDACPRVVSHHGTVALVGLDHQPVPRPRGGCAVSSPGIAEVPLALQIDERAAGQQARVEAAAAQDREDHRRHGRLAAGPGHRDGPVGRHVTGEQLATVQDRQAQFAGAADVGHAVLDGRRDHHGVAGRSQAAAVLRHDGHARAFEAGADLGMFAAVEGAVAAGRAAAAAGVEDGERADAAAGDPDEVVPLRR